MILSRADQVSAASLDAIAMRIAPANADTLIVHAVHEPQCWIQYEQADQPIDALRGQRVAAFRGIGNPASFRRTLADLGCRVTAFLRFRTITIIPDGMSWSSIDWVRVGIRPIASRRRKRIW